MSLVKEIGRVDFSVKEEVVNANQAKKNQTNGSSFLEILKNIQTSGQSLLYDSQKSTESSIEKKSQEPVEKQSETRIEQKSTDEISDDEKLSEEELILQELEKKEKIKSYNNFYFKFGKNIEKTATRLQDAIYSDAEGFDQKKIEAIQPELISTENVKTDFQEMVEELFLKDGHEVTFENESESIQNLEIEESDDFFIGDPRFSENSLSFSQIETSEEKFEQEPGIEDESFFASSAKNQFEDQGGRLTVQDEFSYSKNNEELKNFSDKSEAFLEKVKAENEIADVTQKKSEAKEIDGSFLDKSKWQIRKEKESENSISDRIKKDELTEVLKPQLSKESNMSGDREKGSFDERRSNQFILNGNSHVKEKLSKTFQFENKPAPEKFQRSLNELVKQAKLNIVENGKSSAQISLQPKELGKVLLNVTIEKEVVAGKILVESESVKQLVLSEISGLKSELKSVGLHLENIQVEVGGNNNFFGSSFAESETEKNEGLFLSNKRLQNSLSEEDEIFQSNSTNLIDIKV